MLYKIWSFCVQNTIKIKSPIEVIQFSEQIPPDFLQFVSAPRFRILDIVGPIFDLNNRSRFGSFTTVSHFMLVRAAFLLLALACHATQIYKSNVLERSVHVHMLYPVIATYTRHFILAGFHFSIYKVSPQQCTSARGQKELDPIIRIIHLRPVHVLSVLWKIEKIHT